MFIFAGNSFFFLEQSTTRCLNVANIRYIYINICIYYVCMLLLLFDENKTKKPKTKTKTKQKMVSEDIKQKFGKVHRGI